MFGWLFPVCLLSTVSALFYWLVVQFRLHELLAAPVSLVGGIIVGYTLCGWIGHLIFLVRYRNVERAKEDYKDALVHAPRVENVLTGLTAWTVLLMVTATVVRRIEHNRNAHSTVHQKK